MTRKQEATKHDRASGCTNPDATPEPSSGTKLHEEAVTTSRAVTLGDVPALWLDRLLIAAVGLPVGEGEEAVVVAMTNSLAAIVPDCEFGWSVPLPDGSHTRLFLDRRAEHTVLVSPRLALHIGSDDERALQDRFPPVHLLRRAAQVLSRAVEQARLVGAQMLDRRELAAMQEHIVQTEKLATFGQLAAGIVHDLNNPLTSIVTYSEYLMRKVNDGAGVAGGDDSERLNRIWESANRILRLSRDLVAYARPTSASHVHVTLHAVIDQAIAFCDHVISECGASVERRYGDEIGLVRGAPDQLAQVFVNLITNACQAMPTTSGRLVIETQKTADGRGIQITLADNGHGILPEHLGQVFAPFFTTKQNDRGTGLGLSIVKTIVDGHRGSIRVESEPSRGTRFVLLLPAI